MEGSVNDGRVLSPITASVDVYEAGVSVICVILVSEFWESSDSVSVSDNVSVGWSGSSRLSKEENGVKKSPLPLSSRKSAVLDTDSVVCDAVGAITKVVDVSRTIISGGNALDSDSDVVGSELAASLLTTGVESPPGSPEVMSGVVVAVE